MIYKVTNPASQKICAIKFYRFLTDMGLKESKDFIESHDCSQCDGFYSYTVESAKSSEEINAYLLSFQNQIKVELITEEVAKGEIQISISILGDKASIEIKNANFNANMKVDRQHIRRTLDFIDEVL